MRHRLAAAALVTFVLARPGDARADVVVDWNAIMQATVAGQNPFAQARYAAITQLAVFEAINAIAGAYEPYLDAGNVPPGASPEAAAVAAAHAVLTHYFPANTLSLDAARAASLAAIPDGPPKADGIAVGEAAAAAMIALRINDASAVPQFHAPADKEPGEWHTTAGCPPAGGVLLHWREVLPFALASSSQFRSGPPPGLARPQYWRDFEEVRRVGSAGSALRPPDRAEVARFYDAVLAVGVWNSVARQLIAAGGGSLAEHARILALINMAISDALVTVMESKYHYTFWRPETAIPAAGSDGNRRTSPDAGFTPYIPTPCFPSYPSAHASASYAARTILHRVWGNGNHVIELSDGAVPGVTLAYDTLKGITDDIDDARVFGGIHFRFDQEAGAVQGRAIGRYVYQHYLTPRR